MVDKKEKCKKLIKDNPKLSGNKILEKAKKQNFGIQKSKFYELLREVRDLPEPTQEKKEKSIPIKYKEPDKIISRLPIPKKTGSYGIVEVIDVDEEVSYWIKYETKKDLKRQFQKIKKKYKLKKLSIKYRGIETYTEFIETEFKELLQRVKIEL